MRESSRRGLPASSHLLFSPVSAHLSGTHGTDDERRRAVPSTGSPESTAAASNPPTCNTPFAALRVRDTARWVIGAGVSDGLGRADRSLAESENELPHTV